MTLIEAFDQIVDDVARALNDANMVRGRMAADRLRAIQSEIHSCAKDPRVAAIHGPFEEPAREEEPVRMTRARGHKAQISTNGDTIG